MASELTPAQKSWQAEEEFKRRFTAAEISSMSISEFAALTGRSLRVTAPVPETVPDPVSVPVPDDVPEGAPEAQGISVLDMSPAQYAAVRGQLGMGVSRKEGRGIFDSVPSSSAEYAAAVRRQAGRTALSTANVVQPPRLERYMKPDAPATGRTGYYR